MKAKKFLAETSVFDIASQAYRALKARKGSGEDLDSEQMLEEHVKRLSPWFDLLCREHFDSHPTKLDGHSVTLMKDLENRVHSFMDVLEEATKEEHLRNVLDIWRKLFFPREQEIDLCQTSASKPCSTSSYFPRR